MTPLPPARILDVDPTAYHRLPGFSSSLAKVLIAKSAAHARDAYQRRVEQIEAEDESDDEDVTPDKRKRLESGSIDHALVLGKGKRIETIPTELLAKNGAISTKDAKAFCDAARKAGRIPLKEADREIHERVATVIKNRLEEAGHILDGTSELAIEWHEATPHGPVQCRCMLDHVVLMGEPGPTTAIIYELKPVADAHPDRCERTAENLGYAIAAAAYPRALNALYPTLAGRVQFRFLWCETRRPHEIWDPMLSGAFREIGERRWLRAVHAWAEGIATNRWPGYRTPDRVEITAPNWTLTREGYPIDER